MSYVDPGAPPPVPTEFQIYNSYVIDPMWQRKFSYIWAGAAGVAILLALPRMVRSVRSGRAWASTSGVWEDFSDRGYEPVVSQKRPVRSGPSKWRGVQSAVTSFTLWTPSYVGLNVGQILVVSAYYVLLLMCITIQAPLMDNPNRAGFLALAQLPVVFLLGTKNSVLSLALGPGHGWEKLNYIHRWSGRGMALAAAVHGSLWIRNHLQYNLPILGQQKETSGVACLGLLCVIVLTSLRPVRVLAYQYFFVIHVLGFVAFFITVCYHTIYAPPWIFPPLAFYGLDMVLRLLRYRIKDAALVACGDQMTIIHVNDCDGGWVAGQHVRLRVFFGGRVFESHPLTILSAPPRTSCLQTRALTLGARATGDWSRALNAYARAGASAAPAGAKAAGKASAEKGACAAAAVPVQVMLDGPYGGCGVDLGEYESVLLVAGGSGATFTLGLLDDIVGRCVKLGRAVGERTRRIEFAWCTKSFGCIEWFAPMLMDIAHAAAGTTLDLHITIFVTCLCSPEDVPAIPNSDVLIERPSVRGLLSELLAPPAPETSAVVRRGAGGGVAVCAAGPETLTREARNAVARVALTRGVELGGIVCHTELFSL